MKLSPILNPAMAAARVTYAWPWQPDRGDGTYHNPVIYADYSDPDVVRVGDDFYLTSSSFKCTPGLPLLHSRDLVNWTIIGHAVKNLPHPRYAMVQPGCGIWAPSIRFHAGKFWIFFAMPDEGIYMVSAEHPARPWSEPQLVQAGRGLIDPCPFWDDDGQAYLVHAYAGSRAGVKHRLRVCPMAPDGSRLLGEGKVVFHELKRGDLKLGLGIGGLVFVNFATSALLFFAMRFTRMELLGAAIVWGLVFSFANGFMEELWLRGILLRRFQPFIGVHGSVWLTAIVFALKHGAAYYFMPSVLPIFVLNTLTLGLACGYLMMKSDSIWGAVLIHVAADFFLFVAVLANA